MYQAYTCEPWNLPVSERLETEAFLALPTLSDGIYRLACGARTLDLLLQGVSGAQGAGTLLVNLVGAVTGREKASGPFFSGLSLAKTLELPLMALADPVVSYEPSVGLAWYAGAAGQVDLPQRMVRLIDHVARTAGLRPILFGGSGGGFAVLNVLQHMKHEALGFIWNPQTRFQAIWQSLSMSTPRPPFPRPTPRSIPRTMPTCRAA